MALTQKPTIIKLDKKDYMTPVIKKQPAVGELSDFVKKNTGVSTSITPSTPVVSSGKDMLRKETQRIGATVANTPKVQPQKTPTLLSVSDFAARIKEKYPVYADKDDSELVEKMLEKYPQYKDRVDRISRSQAIYERTKPQETDNSTILEKIGVGLAGAARGVAETSQNLVSSVGGGLGFDMTNYKKGQQDINNRIFGKAEAVSPKAAKIGRVAGNVLASSAAIPGVGPLKNVGLAGRLAIRGAEGAAQTQAASYLAGKGPATLKETLIGAAIGGGAEGISSLKKPLYNIAFRGTKKGLMERGINLEGKLPGEIIADSGLKGVQIKTLLKSNKNRLQNTREEIMDASDAAGNIIGKDVKGGIKQDMYKSLGLENLPKEAQATKDMYSMVDKLVDDYIPDGQIKGPEVVATIKSLNSTLPDKLIGMGIANPSSSKGLTQAMEKGLKSMLDSMAEKGGAQGGLIKSLYQKYSKDKLVEAILKDKELQKTMMRQLIVGSAGATTLSQKDIAEGDYAGAVGKAILGFLLGAGATKVLSSTTAPIVLGKAVGSVNKLVKPAIATNASVKTSSKSENEK